jgi:pimeloyl-ACP methyl ester carboxylesterase
MPEPGVHPFFPKAELAERFHAAYDAVLGAWPSPTESLEVSSPYGTTRVLATGAVDAPPLVLLHGGGATATVWVNNVRELAAAHRVLAVEQVGDTGLSPRSGLPLTGVPDLMAWLNAVLDGLAVRHAVCVGHSYVLGLLSATHFTRPTASTGWCCSTPRAVSAACG